LTTHRENWILNGSEKLNRNLYRIKVKDDFRNGEIFFVFQDKKDIRNHFGAYFGDIKIGINQLEFFKKRIINYVITAVKT
jgi:hypothetical protein